MSLNRFSAIYIPQLNCVFRLLIACVLSISILQISSYAVASDDWVYDLRYSEFTAKAEKGDANAMYDLGVMHERGHGVDKSYSEAIKWYEKAKQKNNPEAIVRLGKYYLEGIGVKKNYKKAFKLLKKAEKLAAHGSYYYLAVIYEKGYGTKKDLPKAKKNYDKAAKFGNYAAQEKSVKLAALLKRSKKSVKKPKRSTKKPKSSQRAKNKVKNNTDLVSEYREKSQTKIDTQSEVTKKRSNRKFMTIKDIKKILLTGLWYDGAKPVGFLPSPRTYCIPKYGTGLRCVSKELSRQTSREKVYYLIESKISEISNYGEFTITYKNNVTKVDVFNSKNSYQTRIKNGPQRKSHILKCSVEGNNISCNKNGLVNFELVNLTKTKVKRKNLVYESAYDN